MSTRRFTASSHRPYLKKSKWTADEDAQLRAAIDAYGTSSWGKIGLLVSTRSGKQCRERWIGQLAPTVLKDSWTPEEDATIIHKQAMTGNKWTVIAAELPGRTALQIKNRWNWLIRHQALFEERAKVVPLRHAPDVLEHTRQTRTTFEPLASDDRLFGAAFQAFRDKMFG
jgi:hypothetical protein